MCLERSKKIYLRVFCPSVCPRVTQRKLYPRVNHKKNHRKRCAAKWLMIGKAVHGFAHASVCCFEVELVYREGKASCNIIFRLLIVQVKKEGEGDRPLSVSDKPRTQVRHCCLCRCSVFCILRSVLEFVCVRLRFSFELMFEFAFELVFVFVV